MNLSININLLAFRKSAITMLTGKSGNKVKCLVIPIEDAGLVIGSKGVYANITAFEMAQSEYGQSHLLKQYVPVETYQNMSSEEKRLLPIFGHCKLLQKNEVKPSDDYNEQDEESKNLPF